MDDRILAAVGGFVGCNGEQVERGRVDSDFVSGGLDP